MAKALAKPPRHMTVEQFVDWAMAQPDGRYELLDGEVLAMAPERAAHARVKARTWRALEDAIAERGVLCEALPDGMTEDRRADCLRARRLGPLRRAAVGPDRDRARPADRG
jgi:Uma2 family endonuclease